MKPPAYLWQPWLIIAAGCVAAMQVGKLSPALPWLQSQLGLSLLESGFLLSAVQGSGMVLGLLLGQWVDGHGLRRSMGTGLLLLATGSALGGLSGQAPAALTVWALLASRQIEGLGFLLTVLPGPALLRRSVDPRHLAPVLGYWGTYMPIGMSLALLVGPFWLQLASWQSWWFFFAVLSALMAVALRRGVAPDPVNDGPAQDRSAMWGRIRQTLGAHGPGLLAALFGVYSAQWLAVVGFLPAIYADAGVQGASLAVLTALAAAVNMGGNMLSGRLLQRGWSERRTLWSGYAAMALGSALAFADITQGLPWVRYLGVLLFSSVGGLIPGTLFSLSVRLAPKPRLVASTVGWMQQISACGQFLGPPMAATLAMAVGGWQFTWAFTLCCALVGAVLTWRVSHHPLVRQ